MVEELAPKTAKLTPAFGIPSLSKAKLRKAIDKAGNHKLEGMANQMAPAKPVSRFFPLYHPLDQNISNPNIQNGIFRPDCIVADPNHPEHVWVGFGGLADFANGDPGTVNGRVMYSPNAGSTWQDISTGLPFFPVTKLVYQDGTDDIMYAATDVGVYRWDKATSQWYCFNTNLPNCVIYDVVSW